MYVKRKIYTLLSKLCCRGIALSVTYSKCVYLYQLSNYTASWYRSENLICHGVCILFFDILAEYLVSVYSVGCPLVHRTRTRLV